MTSLRNPSFSSPRQPQAAGDIAVLNSPLYLEDDYIKRLWLSVVASVGTHFGIIAAIAIIYLILSFLGWILPTLPPPKSVNDIEFQLVDAPTETPRNPKTKNRAEHNTRAGGQKIPNVREAQTIAKAGTPKPNPVPARQAQANRPQPRVAPAPKAQPRPARTQSQPTPKVVPQRRAPVESQEAPTNAPPRPRVTAPRPSTAPRRTVGRPNPLSPIQVPDAPGPVAQTGPLVRGPVGGGGGSPSGKAGARGSGAQPATVPGQFAGGGGRPSAGGGPSGQGGRGSYSQYGSPGGGGGRAGIDAIAEPDFGPYLAELQRRIRRNWTPPEDREDKTVVMTFTIARDGRLLKVTTKRSAGFANADAAARQAVERSAPFRPLPAEYKRDSINVEFTFDYNVFTGRSGGLTRR